MAQLTIQQAFDLALQYHQSGRLREAEQLYRQTLTQQPQHAGALQYLGMIAFQRGQKNAGVDLLRRALVVQPKSPDAHYNLGVALQETGDVEGAIAVYRKAVVLKPHWPEAYNNLGNAFQAKGRLDEAVAAYRQVISLTPNSPEVHNNLGNALKAKGNMDEAEAAYRRAIALKPGFPEAHNSLGIALEAKGQLDEAIAAYRQALVLNPAFAEACGNLGNALLTQGYLDEAVIACRRAIALKPNWPEAHSNLGNALKAKGNLDEAIAAYRQAIVCNPEFPDAYSNLGNALKEKGDFEEAIVACRRAIALRPDYPEAHNNLGNALQAKGRFDEAVDAYRGAIAIKATHAAAHNNLGNSLQATGQLDEALGAYRQAIALKPDYPEAHSNLLLSLHYHPDFDAAAMALEHQRWNQQYAASLTGQIRPHANDRKPDRRLRIGYVSPDFRDHVVARFLLPLLANHDHRIVEVFGYAEVLVPDAMTRRLAAHADAWRSLVGLSDAQAADLIRRDGVDVLVDLAGHTARNRLLVFAYKPAPVQVSYLGYPDATGLSTMDYRLTDAYADPAGEGDVHCSEQLIRLSPSAWCFQPVQSPPVVQREGGPITFGCFNTLAKITEPMLKVWGRILLAVPESRLLLKAAGLSSARVCQRIQRLLGEMGIDPQRLELRGYEADYSGHLALYGRVDVALDSFPYHGTATTCDALWMGVPVVSLSGTSHVSRVGVSLLSNVGLADLVAGTPEQYVQIATGLANDVSRLKELRRTLRERMEASPLMDGPGFARNVEAAYRQMWRTWCTSGERGPG